MLGVTGVTKILLGVGKQFALDTLRIVIAGEDACRSLLWIL